MIPADANPSIRPLRHVPSASLALAAAAASTLVLLAHHPAGNGHDTQLQDLVRQAGSLALVHGVLIGVVAALLYGVTALALQLGIRRPAIAFGLAAYGFGCAAMTGAMLLDGFVSARLAHWLLASGRPADGAVALALIGIGIQILTRTGLVAMGVGICCLSWTDARGTRLLAALALPGGLAPLLAAAFGSMLVQPHVLIALTGLQALWYAGAALSLWRAQLSR